MSNESVKNLDVAKNGTIVKNCSNQMANTESKPKESKTRYIFSIRL